jgi:hypothetical protein
MVHMAKIKQDNINNVRAHVRWYCRPVGAIGDASWFVRVELHRTQILKLLHFLIYEPHCFIYRDYIRHVYYNKIENVLLMTCTKLEFSHSLPIN